MESSVLMLQSLVFHCHGILCAVAMELCALLLWNFVLSWLFSPIDLYTDRER